ncbi:MAG: serine/threonine-protein kinase [Candidatus Melainabacteria bacterium]|nr:serine/threonine-protein kinase [Candidatus Melainabacteria bacterium]
MVDLCPNCKQPKAGGKSGSLTQWIFICHCDSLKNDDSDSATDSYKFQICRSCKKRVNTGREGSLTQFVFRSDSCRCEFPELVDVAVARTADAETSPKGDTRPYLDTIDDIEGIELSSESFPTNRFKPIREIGRGASGAVYLCIDRLLGNNVAVKTLHYLAADQLLGFQQEARAISRLSHPNIVKILDFGATEAGTPYMVLEYIDGVDLETLVSQSGGLDLNNVLEVMLKVCDALAYSHLKEIYHRDLKPSNILIEQTELGLNAKLVDFGVARIKFETLEPTICQGTTVIGTPAYMSPDQMRGISYDQRSELYSLGCILFELLAGRQIYSAETAMEMMSLHASAPIPSLSEVREDVAYPGALDKILARCLAKLPEDRYQSVHALKNDLAHVLETELYENKTVPVNWNFAAEEERGPRIDYRKLSEDLSGQSSKKSKIVIFAITAAVILIGTSAAYLTLNPNQHRGDVYAPPSANTPVPKPPSRRTVRYVAGNQIQHQRVQRQKVAV